MSFAVFFDAMSGAVTAPVNGGVGAPIQLIGLSGG
jgi:hypothetical protein